MNLQEMICERDELNRRIAKEEAAIRDADFRAAIRRHKITMDQVQLRDDCDGNWFGDVFQFNAWCDKNSKKRFREWNTMVYFAGASFQDHLCDIDTIKKMEVES